MSAIVHKLPLRGAPAARGISINLLPASGTRLHRSVQDGAPLQHLKNWKRAFLNFFKSFCSILIP
jgi:hypothetical protein